MIPLLRFRSQIHGSIPRSGFKETVLSTLYLWSVLLPIVLVCYSSLINRFPDYGALTDLSDQLYPMEDKVCSQSVKTRSKRYPVCSHVWKNGKELKFPVFRLFNWSILWGKQMVFILQSAKLWSPDDYSMVQLTIWPDVAKPFYHIQYPVNSKIKYMVTKTTSRHHNSICFHAL